MPRRGAVDISYRTEAGAVPVAIAASGLVGVGQRWRRGRSRRVPTRPGVSGVVGVGVLLVAAVVGAVLLAGGGSSPAADATEAIAQAPTGSALAALRQVAVQGRAPKTGYSRAKFGEAWQMSITTAATRALTSCAAI